MAAPRGVRMAVAATAAGFLYDPFTAGFQRRAHAIYRTLRDEHPLYENPERGFFALSRFDDVWNATLDLETLTTEGVEEARSLRPMLNYLDPPRHDRLRALVSRAFTWRRVEEMEPVVRRTARELIDGFADAGRCELIEAFAEPLPGRLVAEMIGVPPERRESFLSHTRRMLSTEPGKSITETIRDPWERIYEEFARLLEERRAGPAATG
jgi:cytochrome P450